MEGGYTRVANELLEEAAKRKFNSTQASIVFFVLRHTYGFQRKSHELSVGYIAGGVGAHPGQIKRELKRLIDQKVIQVFQEATHTRSRKIGMNKHCEEWEVPTHGQLENIVGTTSYPGNYAVPTEDTEQLPHEDTKQYPGVVTDGFPEVDTDQYPKERKYFKDIVYTVFQHWNSKRITVHRELTETTQSAIKARLKVYPVETLLEAIDNYNACLIGEEFYYSHKFTLKEFMNPKNVDKFLTENDPFSNFLKRSSPQRSAGTLADKNQREIQKIRELMRDAGNRSQTALLDYP